MGKDPQSQEAEAQVALMARMKANAEAFKRLHEKTKAGQRLTDQEHAWYQQVLAKTDQRKAESTVVGLSAEDAGKRGVSTAATGAVPPAATTAEAELKRLANLQLMAEGFGGNKTYTQPTPNSRPGDTHVIPVPQTHTAPTPNSRPGDTHVIPVKPVAPGPQQIEMPPTDAGSADPELMYTLLAQYLADQKAGK